MLAPLKVPFATAVYAIAGLVLAKFWFDAIYWPTLAAALSAIALMLGLAPVGRNYIPSKPRRALAFFEAYWWVNGLATAVLTCAAVLATVELTGLAGTEDPTKELVTQSSAALTALIGGVVVATKDADETFGKRIAKEFQARFTMEGQEEEGKVTLRRESPSLIAVFTRYENGWTDWSEVNRGERVESLQQNLHRDRAS